MESIILMSLMNFLKPIEMNKNEIFAIKKILNSYLMLQLAYDEIECLTDTSIFKQENKMRIKNTLNWLEQTCGKMTNNMITTDFENVNVVIDKVRALFIEFEKSFEKSLNEVIDGKN